MIFLFRHKQKCETQVKTPTAGKSLAKAVTGSSGEEGNKVDKVELGKVEGSLSKSRSSSVSSLDQVASHSFYPQGVFFYLFTISQSLTKTTD